MTALLIFLAIVSLAVVLWLLVKAVVADGSGHRPPPPSHHSDLEAGSPLWWVDAWYTGVYWPHSDVRRSMGQRRPQY